jgi:hypothetical protein
MLHGHRCELRAGHPGSHWNACEEKVQPWNVSPTVTPQRDGETLLDRIARYFAWQDSPEFEPCPRCNGKGYHHGFGEGGVDPDWCERCGGPGEQPTEPGMWSPDNLLEEARDALAASPPAGRIAPEGLEEAVAALERAAWSRSWSRLKAAREVLGALLGITIMGSLKRDLLAAPASASPVTGED